MTDVSSAAARTCAPQSIALITLGCAKNEVDSHHMAQALIGAGHVMVDDPAQADVVIINTCSFIQSATEESLDVIFEAAELPGVEQGKVPLIVAGCMPARYGDDLKAELTEASAFVPCSKEDDIVAVVNGLFFQATESACVPELAQKAAQLPQQNAPFAYVKISDGCNRFCSFCTIPFIRGRYHSFTYETIAAQVQEHVDNGVREIVLIAQDTGNWGCDFPEKRTLAWLLEQLAVQHPATWFRVLYTEPEGVTDDLLRVMASHENICSYLDIPLQHVDEGILRSMNRRGNRQKIEALLAHIQDMLPDVTLRTTLIAGFPGETDEQFEELCDFVESSPFSYIGVFAYSREEGTAAADFKDQVPEEEKLARTQELRDLADAVCAPRIAQRIGTRCKVLVEDCEADGQLYGRTQSQAPEVDGVTYLNAGTLGEFEQVEIVDTLLYEMEGEVVA